MTRHRITEVSRFTGLSARALRHYEQLGLVSSHRAPNGYREYDETALLRLQRILVLRELGVALDQIARILDRPDEASEALGHHAAALQRKRERITQQIGTLERTLSALEHGEPIMNAAPFDGFEHEQYEAEVSAKWGADSYAQSDAWWRSKTTDERTAWKADLTALQTDWMTAASAGVDPRGAEAQALAKRQVNWLREIPGAPTGQDDLPGYLRGLGEMYVADERFAVNYGGVVGATFVRDALSAYADALAGEH